MLGALVAGGASLLSGLFGRSSAKKQAKKEEAAIREANAKAEVLAADMNRQARLRADAAALVPVQSERENATTSVSQGGVDMDAFMSAAENYGFNPLTFLRSGALSLFARTESATHSLDWECTTGERAMEAAQAGQYIPQLSPVISQTKVPGVGEVFGNALTTGVNQYLNDAANQAQFQNDLMLAQLRGANRYQGAPLSRSFYGPAAYSDGGKVTTKGPLFDFTISGIPEMHPAYNNVGWPGNDVQKVWKTVYNQHTGQFTDVASDDMPDLETTLAAAGIDAEQRYRRAGERLNNAVRGFWYTPRTPATGSHDTSYRNYD